MTATLISGFGAILVAALTWLFSRERDRENAWRATKLAHYEHFLGSLSRVVSASVSLSDKQDWAHACNVLHLVAPKNVIIALYDFQRLTSPPPEEIDTVAQDAALTRLVEQIRLDLGLPLTKRGPTLTMRLWSAPKS